MPSPGKRATNGEGMRLASQATGMPLDAVVGFLIIAVDGEGEMNVVHNCLTYHQVLNVLLSQAVSVLDDMRLLEEIPGTPT